ncbi:MAG: hypothetical protein LBC97_13905 [Bifidobacteriaceae bacterium]|jgi:hypothetical protein|nr:hypothetical protein [Bifidobacteriaceae bacterium]
MATHANHPVVVREQPNRRRFAGVLGSLSLGVALVAGATVAAFTDSEYGRLLGDNNGNLTTGKYNIQISTLEPGEPGQEWKDTAYALDGIYPTAPDNLANDTASPVALQLNTAELVPGEALSTIFWVRNDSYSSEDTSLKLRLINETAAADNAGLLGALQFKVSVNDSVIGSYSYADLAGSNLAPLHNSLVRDTAIKIKLEVLLPQSASGGAVQGQVVKLIAEILGQSV